MFKALFSAAFGLMLLVTPAVAAEPWGTYVNREYGFSIEMPGTVTAEDLPAAGDGKVSNRLFSAGDAQASYGVSVIVLPEGFAFNLDDGVAGVVGANKGAVVSDETLTVQGYPARKVEYAAESDGQAVTAWLLIVSTPGRVFSVLTAQIGQPKPADTERVLNSFKLLD